jgi:hypothetical protein
MISLSRLLFMSFAEESVEGRGCRDQGNYQCDYLDESVKDEQALLMEVTTRAMQVHVAQPLPCKIEDLGRGVAILRIAASSNLEEAERGYRFTVGPDRCHNLLQAPSKI